MKIIGRRTPWIINRMIRQAITPAPEPTAVENFRLARNAVANVLAVPAFDIVITPSQTTAPNPAAVTFDIFTNSTFTGIERPLHECSYFIDYDDAGSVYENIPVDHPFGNDANLTQGAVGGHVWQPVGTKTVKAYVYHHPTGKFGYKEQEIIVADADTIFNGNKTIVVALDGIFTGAPAGSQQFTTAAAARTAFYALGSVNKRLLFKRGEVYEGLGDFFDQTFNEFIYIGYWGAGDDPEIKLNPIGETTSNKTKFWFEKNSGAHIYGLKITGDYNPVTGTGENWADNGVLFKGGARHCVSKCTISGMGLPVYASDSTNMISGFMVYDNAVLDWYDLGVFPVANVLPIVGNTIKQNINAVSGKGEKGNYENEFTGDGTTNPLTLTNVRLFGEGASYLAVAIIDDALKTVTYWTEGVDYTLTVGANDSGGGSSNHILTPITVFESGKRMSAYTRRWADHGPIRVSKGYGVGYLRNDLASYTGWSGEGTDIQSCIRDNTAGVVDYWSFCNQNRMMGGFTVITRAPQNVSTTQFATDFICETNVLTGDYSTRFHCNLYSPGSTFRNNYCFMPNVSEAGVSNFFGMTQYGELGAVPEADWGRPIVIANNTLACLISTANNVKDVYAASSYYQYGALYTNVTVDNNLIFCPDRPTPLPDYSPLATDSYYQPEAGSAALDAGTSLATVWDTFNGELVEGAASIGPFDSAYVSPLTQAEFTRSPAVSAQSSTVNIPVGSDFKLTHQFIIPTGFSTTSGVIALVGETTSSLTRAVFDSSSNVNGPNRLYMGGVTGFLVNDTNIVNDGLVHILAIEYINAENLLYFYVDGNLAGTSTPESSQQVSGNFVLTVNNYRPTIGGAFVSTLYCHHSALYTELSINGSVNMAFDYTSGALSGETENASQGAGTLLMYGDPIWS